MSERDDYVDFLERIVVSDARGALIALQFFIGLLFALFVLAYVKHQASCEDDWIPEVLSWSGSSISPGRLSAPS